MEWNTAEGLVLCVKCVIVCRVIFYSTRLQSVSRTDIDQRFNASECLFSDTLEMFHFKAINYRKIEGSLHNYVSENICCVLCHCFEAFIHISSIASGII